MIFLTKSLTASTTKYNFENWQSFQDSYSKIALLMYLMVQLTFEMSFTLFSNLVQHRYVTCTISDASFFKLWQVCMMAKMSNLWFSMLVLLYHKIYSFKNHCFFKDLWDVWCYYLICSTYMKNVSLLKL